MNLTIEDLSVSYNQLPVIKHISFQVDQGCFFTILGQSGSGKSTILKAIAGLHKQQQGKIILKDVDISLLPTEQRNIAYVFQKPLLFPHLNVEENIRFGPEIHGWSEEKIQLRVKELMCLVQIEGLEERMPNEISGGQQQRVAIARALALNHQILLMDEPFSSLDPYLREEMGLLVKSIQQKLNLTVIFVTHDVQEAMTLSDHICFLSNGQLAQCGTPDTIYNYPATREIGDFMGKANWVEGTVSDHQFTSPFGKLQVTHIDGDHLTMMIRPHNLQIIDKATSFEVLSSQRIGKETITEVFDGHCRLIISELEDKSYSPGQKVGVSQLNHYNHMILL